MENMEKVKAELQALNEAHSGAAGTALKGSEWSAVPHNPGWAIALHHPSHGKDYKGVPVALAEGMHKGDARAAAAAVNALPKLTDALTRVLKIAGELEHRAIMRDAVASIYKVEGNYELYEAHHKFASRIRAVQRLLCEEISEAFGLDTNTEDEGESNGN